jgi:hypothetical protein
VLLSKILSKEYARLLAVKKCMYLPPTYLHFIQDIEDRYLLLMSSTTLMIYLFKNIR